MKLEVCPGLHNKVVFVCFFSQNFAVFKSTFDLVASSNLFYCILNLKCLINKPKTSLFSILYGQNAMTYSSR